MKEIVTMNQLITGQYIARKRKEKNMTQAQLAERLGVSNKAVSKWENGKCMPDYSIVEDLCKELEITIAELMDGENAADGSIRAYDNTQIMELLKRTQELEKQKNIIYGVLIMFMGIALMPVSHMIGGTDIKDFVSGVIMGISIAVMLVGIYCTIRNSAGK